MIYVEFFLEEQVDRIGHLVALGKADILFEMQVCLQIDSLVI